MKTKNVEKVFSPPPTRWVGNGFKVHNFFPSLIEKSRMSPFFLLDYNAKTKFPPSNTPQGVSSHPHRGIETVTISYLGKVAHHDSVGNGGVIEEGDCQWMTAGGGILHKEYHEEKFNKQGGDFQMVQLWVNLPAKDKFAKPNYQAIFHKNIPKYQLPNNAGTVEIIAGNFKGRNGVASTFSPIELYTIKLKKDKEAIVTLPANHNTGLLMIEGTVNINGSNIVPTDHFALFANEGEEIQLKAEQDAVLLMLSGTPLNEPIVGEGPFVMNTREEIDQAFQDFSDGKFGYLE